MKEIPNLKAREAAMVAALRKNPNAPEVAGQFGANVFDVWWLAKEKHITLKGSITKKLGRRPHKKENEIIAALMEDPHAGQVTKRIGGVCYLTVCRIAKKAKIELTAGKAARGNRTPRISEQKRKAVLGALEIIANATQVAKAVGGVSHVTVGNIAHKEKMPLPKRGRPKKQAVEPAILAAA